MTKKLIYLEDAIDALAEQLYYNEDDYRTAVKAIGGLPSAQPELDEWCPDCKEYDSKRHCCPRLNRVIRQMVKDAQSERKKANWEKDEHYGEDKTGTDHCEADAVRMAIKALEEQLHWIPCSERLPEEDGRYLVTCSRWGAWAVDWNIWSNEPKPSWLWEQGVTAWMPLPEPYGGETK